MNGFTVVWRFENFSYYWQKEDGAEINSPEFQVNAITGTKWKLKLFGTTHGFRMEDSIGLCLQREEMDGGPDCLVLDLELAFIISGRSLVYTSERFLNNFRKGDNSDAVYAMKDDVLSQMREAFLPQDVLTVRCRMWELDSPVMEEEQCLVRTIIGIERAFFLGTVENANCLVPGLKKVVHVSSSSTDKLSFFMTIRLTDEGKFFVEIPLRCEYLKLFTAKVMILDNFGNWRLCGQSVDWKKSGQTCEFPLNVLFETLVSDKRLYLPKGAMTLKCEISFSVVADPDRVETVDYGFDMCQNIQWMASNNENSNSLHIIPRELEFPGTLKSDLVALYKEGALCDAKLCTETEMFLAHKTVLCARSPVFKTMFTSDMRERADECVNIPDLDDDTVRKMLHFLYTDTLEDLQWDGAKNLYFAADKYGIVSLKQKCSSFLKHNLQTSNCCDLLLLADMHNDADLKAFVLDYIVLQDQQVFLSSEWEMFMKNHVHLAAEAYTMYFKFGKT
ncbi:TD and POZ domain-containing protein 5 [Argiope bruennichi]|uniref:TD and POZ domain-containing protein 5 n=1 Tax=Argiope bruennichi TaxID=94029 RepID=A0A8T0ECZ1_ARGBR|nr:TD and POZ domain-containing protein 5 [Argiope bruennichi]